MSEKAIAKITVEDRGVFEQVSRPTLTLKLIKARLETASVQVPKKLIDDKEVFLVGFSQAELDFLLHMLKDI